MEEKANKVEKRTYNSGNRVGVRIVAGILAFLMISSLTATVVSYFI
ncbi:MAG: hypothetical protein J6A89_06970 [Clostridia bacterium]|nr:hypothetical protein [Clostridia bacterium]